MTTAVVIQARIGSTRLPGKVMYALNGQPMILFLMDRVARAKNADVVALATSDQPADDILAQTVAKAGYPVIRGPEDDVLRRYTLAATALNADLVVRVTGDCPFSDPALIDALIELLRAEGADYATNVKPETWPDGLDLSVFTSDTLIAANQEASLPSEREHVVPWMWKESSLQGGSRLKAVNLPAPRDLSALRWTIDEADDFLCMQALVEALGTDRAGLAGWQDILNAFEQLPRELKTNQDIIRDAGYLKSLQAEGGTAT